MFLEYTNETGGSTSLRNISSPFSVKITKKVEFADMLYLGTATIDDSGNTTTLEILVDGSSVEKKRFVNDIAPTIAYLFQ